MSHFKRSQRKYVKKTYRVRNWHEYEAGLRERGSLIVWISLHDGKLANWDAPRPKNGKPGRQRKYSNHAIETAVTLGMVFGLASRQTEGFICSLFTLLNLNNDVPDHTTISRRKAKLGKVPFYENKQKTPLHILIDSSGLTESGYSKRSQVETTFYCYKIILGSGNASERVGVTKSRSKDWVQDSKHDDGAGAALQ